MQNKQTFNVGIYLRLSREDEKKGESTSISNQRDIIMNYIKQNNLNFIAEYIDDGVSGTQFERLGWQQLITDIENKKINMIITKDLSRFGRNEGQQLRYLDYFSEYGIRYVSILDNVDTADETNTSNEMIPIQCFFNEKHVRDTSKKMKASVYIKRSQGNFLGSTPPYGYKKDPNNKYKLIIDEEAASIVKRIFTLFINGTGICEISRILTTEKIAIPSIHKNLNRGLKSQAYGHWSNRTISDILTLPTYMGDLTQGRLKKTSYKSKKIIRQSKDNWIICKNKCPAIITREIFELAQNMYNHNKNQKHKNSNLLLKGLVYCKECDHAISFRTQTSLTKKGQVTRCYGNCNFWSKHKIYSLCTPHNTKYYELEILILNELKKLIKTVNSNLLKKFLKKNDPFTTIKKQLLLTKNKLTSEIKLAEKKQDNLYHDKLAEIIDLKTYQKFSNQLSTEINSLQLELKKIIEQQEKLQTKIVSTDKKLEQIIKEFLELNPPSIQLISSMIEKITITEDKKIDIYYKFIIPNK